METEVIPRKERNEIYKKALEFYLKQISEHSYFGLCFCISQSSELGDIYGHNYCPFYNMQNYPEIFKRKPEIPYSIYYWFHKDNTAIRIEILTNAIKETNDDSSKDLQGA